MTKNNDLFKNIVDALVNDGYAIIPNALHTQLPSHLKKIAQNNTDFQQAGISASSQVHTDSLKRRDKTSWIDEDNSYQSEYLKSMQDLQDTLNRELYMGIQYYESHFAMYEEGDFYEKHLDAFKGSKNRVVTTVYYLNDDWEESDGGALIMYGEGDTPIKKVLPQANTLVVFLSEKFPHEVLASQRKRFSIAGWFRIDK